MTNILIGLVALVLFIAIALAAAVYLGPKFRDSSSNGAASALVSKLSQTSQAVSLYESYVGTTFPDFLSIDDTETRLIPIYLKKAPLGNFGARPVTFTGLAPQPNKRWILLGGLTLNECAAAQKNINGSVPVPDVTTLDAGGWPVMPATPSGCMNVTTSSNRMLYMRI